MRVSFIVPVYNAEAFLSDCLLSIQRQTVTDFEVLCVDDGSSDRSVEIIRSFTEEDERFRLLSQENGGASAARNSGYDKAVGESVTFVDADDEIAEDFLANLLGVLDDHSADIAIGNKMIVRGDVSSAKTPELEDGVVFGARFERHQLATHVAPHGKIYRRSFLQDHGIRFREGITYEDYIYWLLCLTKDPKVAMTSRQVYTYKRNPDSISSVARRLNSFNVYSRIIQTDECVQIAIDSKIPGLENRVFRKQFSATLMRHVKYLAKAKDKDAARAAFKQMKNGLQPHRERILTLLKGWKRLVYMLVLDGTLGELVKVLRLVDGKATSLQVDTVEGQNTTRHYVSRDQLPSLDGAEQELFDVTDALRSLEKKA